VKILFVIGELPYGGVESLLFDIVKGLLKMDDVSPVIANISGMGKMAEEFESLGVRIINVGHGKKSVKTLNLNTLRKMKKVIKSEKPDIIHTMHFSADYFGRLANKGTNIPIITHLHNNKLERRAFRRVAHRYLSRFTTAYLSVSKLVKDHVDKNYNRAGRENFVLYNAIDFDKVRSAEKVDIADITGKEARYIVSAGRLADLKNFDGLIKGFGLIADKFKEWNLLIAGDGAEFDYLRKTADETEFGDRIFLPGYHDNIPGILKSADIFCLVSHKEGFGITHLEAMAAGTPSIISDKVPTAEVADGTAVICTTDEKDIAEKIEYAISAYDVMKKKAQKAEFIAATLDINAYIDELMQIYHRLIGDKK